MRSDRMGTTERRPWLAWVGLGLLGAFLTACIAIVLIRHAAFQTNMFDLGYYTQIIWNTAHGHWFATSLKPQMQLGDHFSPIEILLAPLFWFVPDARTLLVVEVLALVSAAVPAYLLLRRKYPMLAPVLLLAFALNPLFHQTVSHEFHESMLAAPTLALSVYALITRKDRLLWLGLALTLLVREDMALYVGCFGLYLLLFRPGRRWHGVVVMLVSVAWLVLLTGYVIPALGSGVYYHTGLFSRFGDSVPEILQAIVRDPWSALEPIVASVTNGSLLWFLLPFAALVLLAKGEQILWIPALLLLILSEDPFISRLESWHMGPMIPILWASVAAVIARLRPRPAILASGLLLAAAIAGFLLWSPFPGGGRFEAAAFQITDHVKTGHRIVASIPSDVSLATQSKLGPHLSVREDLHLYPWFDWNAPPEMIVLDAKTTAPYPLTAPELQSNIALLQMQANLELVWEEDGYYVFRIGSDLTNPRQGPWAWDSTLELADYALAQSCGTGAFLPVGRGLEAGCTLRVELSWRTLAQPTGDYTISVRLLAPDGQAMTQADSRPARGTLNTLDWAVGRTIRDTHYLSVPLASTPTELSLVVLVYDTVTLEPIAPTEGQVLTRLPFDDAPP